MHGGQARRLNGPLPNHDDNRVARGVQDPTANEKRSPMTGRLSCPEYPS